MAERESRGRGRPPFEPTPEMRREVEILVAGKMSEDQIAGRLKIAPKTLRLHFREELDAGFGKRNGEFILNTYAVAMSTDATSSDRNLWWKIMSAEGGQSSEAVKKLGKKEIAAAEATKAGQGTDWGDLLTRNQNIN